MSDMTGAKAAALAEMARSDGRSFLRFDYSGHGASGGSFEEQTLSNWLEDASLMFASFTTGDQIIAGSSMGGYLALLLMRAAAAGSRSRPPTHPGPRAPGAGRRHDGSAAVAELDRRAAPRSHDGRQGGSSVALRRRPSHYPQADRGRPPPSPARAGR